MPGASAISVCMQLLQRSGPWWKKRVVPVSGKPAARLSSSKRTASTEMCVSNLFASLQLVYLSRMCASVSFMPSPKGPTWQKASFLGFVATSLAPSMAAQGGKVLPTSAAACQDGPVNRKGGSPSEQPSGECILTWFKSPSMGRGPSLAGGTCCLTSADAVIFCIFLPRWSWWRKPWPLVFCSQ